MEEKRHSKRMDIDVEISVKEISNGQQDADKKLHTIDVINLSTGGIAFLCEDELKLDTYYDVHIIIWTKEKIDTVIHLVRKKGNEYGGQFVGIPEADRLKIKIYELINFPGNHK